jgi:selenophosphate synthetase-related protein
VDESAVDRVCARFDAVGIAAAAVGRVTTEPLLELQHAGEAALYWDLGAEPLTGFGA